MSVNLAHFSHILSFSIISLTISLIGCDNAQFGSQSKGAAETQRTSNIVDDQNNNSSGAGGGSNGGGSGTGDGEAPFTPDYPGFPNGSCTGSYINGLCYGGNFVLTTGTNEIPIFNTTTCVDTNSDGKCGSRLGKGPQVITAVAIGVKIPIGETKYTYWNSSNRRQVVDYVIHVQQDRTNPNSKRRSYEMRWEYDAWDVDRCPYQVVSDRQGCHYMNLEVFPGEDNSKLEISVEIKGSFYTTAGCERLGCDWEMRGGSFLGPAPGPLPYNLYRE